MYLRISVLCFILFLIFSISNNLSAQTNNSKYDSLCRILNFTKTDSVKVRILMQIGLNFQLSDPDTAIYYLRKSIELAKKINRKKSEHGNSILLAEALQKLGWACCVYKTQYDSSLLFSNQAIAISSELSMSEKGILKNRAEKNISDCYINIGRVSTEKGFYDEAIEYYKKSLVIIEKLDDKYGMHVCFFSIGNVYYYQGIFDKAIEYYQKALAVDEKIKNKTGISSCYNNIGNVHLSEKAYDKAIEYYKKSLEMDIELGNKSGISYSYGNIGLVYQSKGNPKLAIEYIEKQLKINEEINDKKGISNCYTNLGNIYQNMGEYLKAVPYFEKSLAISTELDDKYGQALVLTNIALLKIEMTSDKNMSAGEKMKLYKDAVNYAMQAYTISDEIKSLTMKNEAAWILYRAYKAMDNKGKAIEFIEHYVETKDSMFHEDKTNAIAEMETKYQTEKKQLQIGKLEKEKELQTSEMKKQRIIIISVICGLLFVIGFALVVVRMFVQKKRANQIILEKNQELEQANEEIRVQRDVVTNQKDHIEHIHSELTSSIVYAKRIQMAVLPMDEYLKEFLSDYFVLNKPKDIVSGDFFWITKVNTWTLFCVADCTGHGVPGAFMSMLGIALVNEIVRQEEIVTAGQVLDQLRKRVIESLKQKGISGEQQDGMDIAFCALNSETLELQYAGANNPCWIVRHFGNEPMLQFGNDIETKLTNDEQFSNFQINQFPNLTELKPDKMPIGIHDRKNDFTNYRHQMYKGDIIYLMSDGYEDQFGGKNQRKFYAKNLKNLLVENSHRSMEEQKKVLEKTLSDWMIGYDQIDDITILGIKI